MNIEALKTILGTTIRESAPKEGEGSKTITVDLSIFGESAPIAVTTTVQPNDRIWIFEARLDKTLPTTLSALSPLVGGADLAGALPEGLALGKVAVSNLSFAVFSSTIDLISISIGLTSANEWRIAEGLSIKGLFVDFTVNNPANAQARSIECAVGGTLRIGSGEVQLAATAPEFLLVGAIAPTSSINLKSAVNYFTPPGLPITPSLPDVVLTQLELRIAPREGMLALYARAASGAQSGWSLVESPAIALRNVELFLQVFRNGSKIGVAGEIGGTLVLGTLSFFISAELGETITLNGVYLPPPTGPATLADFLGSLELPVAITSAFGNAMTLQEMDFTASPKLRTFHFHARVEPVWQIPITDDTKFEIKNLLVDVDYAPQRPLGVLIEGQLSLTGLGALTIKAERINSGFQIHGRLDNVSLRTLAQSGLARELAGNAITLHDSLASLTLPSLTLTLKTDDKSVLFQGQLQWPIQLGDAGSIRIDAALAMGKTTAGFSFEVEGRVSFDGFSDNEFFQHFSMTASYRHTTGAAPVIHFGLVLGELTLDAEYTSGNTLTLHLGPGQKFGKLLTSLATLVNPSLGDVELDEPFSLLNDFELPDLTFSLNFKEKSFTVTTAKFTKVDLLFLQFDQLALTYTKGALSLDLIDSSAPGQKHSMDPLSPSTPAGAPAKKFDLQYLALGQHVTLSSLAGLHDIKSVMGALQGKVKALPPADRSKSPVTKTLQQQAPSEPPTLVFDANSNWLIAADFSAAGFLALKLIFNDPNVYGIRIELSGEKAKKFAGLQFEILYRRLSDALGVYHTELVLPDLMRFLEFGAVSVTLPIIVLDIYTNGDFKIDVGFPWNGNFDRSFAVQVLPFTGAGGFYFNKLSAETIGDSTNHHLPVLNPAIGNFSPILQFGIGARIGLGKSFNKGPLKAELSVVVQGILEGVFATYNPVAKAPGGTYYMVQGAVAIVGRVYGSVDFEVIRIDVEVIARIDVQFRVECYQPIVVTLTAEVSVNASITILFITVHFSFSLSLTTSFEIPAIESGAPPWKAALQAASGESFRSLPVTRRAVASRLSWAPVQLFASPVEIKLRHHVTFTRQDDPGTGFGFAGVALLFIRNSIPPGAAGHEAHAASAATTDTDFDLLSQALLAWAVFSHQMQTATAGESGAVDIQDLTISRDDLRHLHEQLMTDPNLTFDSLSAFLQANIRFTIEVAEASAEFSGTVFPMFPELRVQLAASGENARATRETLFVEYFVLLLRNLVQYAIGPESQTNVSLRTLLSQLNTGGEFNHLAGLASRFLLHGIRRAHELATQSLFEATGQSFPIRPADGVAGSRLSLEDGATPSAGLVFPAPLLHPFGQAESNYLTQHLTPSPGVVFPDPPGAVNLATDLNAGLYVRQPQKFANSHSFKWAFEAARTLQVVELSQPLQDFLQRKTQGTALNLSRPPATSEGQPEPITQYLYATKITVTIQRIHAASEEGFLADTFLIGGVNDAERQLLEALPATGRSVSLLYPRADNSFKQIARCVLVKTTIPDATGSNPVSIAELQEATSFLPIVRESGLTPSSGYYLRYLPQTEEPTAGDLSTLLFESGQANGLTATLTLLVTSQAADAFPTSAELAQPYHNAVLLLDAPEKAGQPLMAQTSNDADRALTFAGRPGHVGFRVTRPNDSNGGQLKNLYQLLAYRIMTPAISSPFAPSAEESEAATVGERWSYDPTGVPIGPAAPEATDNQTWIYERTIPAYRLFPSSPDDPGLPPQRLNPYNGIAPGNKISLALRWRDLFGNEAPGDAVTLDLPVQYTDPLLGIQEWPSTTAQYSFGKTGTRGSLQFELGFNENTFKSDNDPDQKKASAALEKYKRIWYQLNRADVTLSITTSIAALAAEQTASLKTDVMGFVTGAIEWLTAAKTRSVTKPTAPALTRSYVFSANPTLPNQFVFALTAQLDIKRTNPALIITTLKTAVPQIEQVTTMLAPKVIFAGNESPLSALSAFATGFQKAFPGLRLATSRDEESDATSHLYAAQLAVGSEAASAQGLKFTLRPLATSAVPLHFAPAPLATTMFSGMVKTYPDLAALSGEPTLDKRFDAVDLNVLARQLLVGVEELLSPEIAVRAMNSGQPAIKTQVLDLLASKAKLANAIGLDVATILQPPSTVSISETETALARAALQDLLRVNLVEGYDVEEVILLPTQVTPFPAAGVEIHGSPKLTFHPVVLEVKDTASNAVIATPQFDISLSPATATLTPGANGYLTLRFDTKLPQRCEGRTLGLDFRLSSMEYQITAGKPVHLTFIPTDANSPLQYDLPLVVPLRSYPPSPSLTTQKALADPDSMKNLAQVREWKYAFTYEHLDVSQDTIEAKIEYNIDSSSSPTAPNASAGTSNGLTALFQALVNFTSLYPSILAELRTNLKAGNADGAVTGFTNLAKLVKEAAEKWNVSRAQRTTTAGAAPDTPHQYEINESPRAIETRAGELKEVMTVTVKAMGGSLPTVTVPGFGVGTALEGGTTTQKTFEFSRPPLSQADSPAPSIAARTLTVADLDIVGKQSGSAAIWLTRNKDLIASWKGDLQTAFAGWQVSSAFQFRTPRVRFGNPLKPLLVNAHEWDIAKLDDGTTKKKTLSSHLAKLFERLLPTSIDQPFAIRVACSYAFSLAETAGDDLVATHPVLLSPQRTLSTIEEEAIFRTNLVSNLNAGIANWKTNNNPEERNAEYIFSVSFFSGAQQAAVHAPHLLLRIENLRLKLEDILPA